MKRKIKLKLILISVTAVAAAILVLYPLINEQITRARLSEGKTILSSFAAAQRAYFVEYKTFSSDLKAIGYSSEGKLRGKLYLTADALPKEYLSALNSRDLPHIDKNAFVALYAIPVVNDGKVYFVRGDENNRIEILEAFGRIEK